MGLDLGVEVAELDVAIWMLGILVFSLAAASRLWPTWRKSSWPPASTEVKPRRA
ncbi:MAG TPA: hypothetical protein VLX59_04730 [Acidimicrobiales bacterium]|nr:hypothetical protein [Acidimicrobiales bacterium]